MSSSSAAPLAPVYPESYQYALNNRFTSSQLGSLLLSARPLFVYGSMMIPRIVAKLLNDDEGVATDTDAIAVAQDMTSAQLRNYERFSVKGYAYPAIVPSTGSGDIVEGFVIFGLTDEQRDLINDCYDDCMHPYDLKSVKVEILLATGGCRTIQAETYVWAGSPGQLVEISIHSWALEDYRRDYYASDLAGER